MLDHEDHRSGETRIGHRRVGDEELALEGGARRLLRLRAGGRSGE
jgi:hypothetical protein